MLSDVLAALQVTISALNPSQTITYGLGGSSKLMRNSPPSINWVPARQDRFSVAVMQGPSPMKANGGGIPRSITTRVVALEAHIWCGALDPNNPFNETERMLGCVINALDQNCRTSYELSGGHYEGQQGAELMQLGRLYVLEFSLKLPVTEVTAPAIAAATITSVPQTDQMIFPNSTYQQVP